MSNRPFKSLRASDISILVNVVQPPPLSKVPEFSKGNYLYPPIFTSSQPRAPPISFLSGFTNSGHSLLVESCDIYPFVQGALHSACFLVSSEA